MVRDADPTITFVNDATKTWAEVQIAVMQGVSSGVNDLHYGNNVVVAPGASYTVVVSLNRQSATVHAQIPPEGARGRRPQAGFGDARHALTWALGPET